MGTPINRPNGPKAELLTFLRHAHAATMESNKNSVMHFYALLMQGHLHNPIKAH